MTRQDTLVGKLLDAERTRDGGGETLSRQFLQSVVSFAASYAKLEKLLYGGTRVLYSSSALEMNLALTGDPIAQGEQLADLERKRFELPSGPILELGYLIEDQGVKIIPRAFPADSLVQGGFFFDSQVGPCILLNAHATPAERDYILAHQYGHFLADYDPYVTTLCGRPDTAMLADPRELRAHQFALAYLMSRADLTLYREGMGLGSGEPVSIEFVRQLQVYFDLDFEIVFWRLLSLGWIDAARVELLLRQNPDLELRGAPDEPGPGRLIPERFVHLVASAFGRNLIEIEDAAEFLGTNSLDAKRILNQFSYDEHPDSPGSHAKRPRPGPVKSESGPSLN